VEPCSQRVSGTFRRDALSGGPGPQSIYGRGGDDRLRGGPGDDCLIGGGGADRLSGGPGSDVIRGGRGGDLARSADGIAEFVTCGRGRDRAHVDRIDRVSGCERVRRS
jgi:Ca2+-binding RTX toxin-like protein